MSNVGTLIVGSPDHQIVGVLIVSFPKYQQRNVNLQKGSSEGGGPATFPMIKSAKKMVKMEKRIGAVRIGYLPQWGIFPSYKVRFTKSPHFFLG